MHSIKCRKLISVAYLPSIGCYFSTRHVLFLFYIATMMLYIIVMYVVSLSIAVVLVSDISTSCASEIDAADATNMNKF